MSDRALETGEKSIVAEEEEDGSDADTEEGGKKWQGWWWENEGRRFDVPQLFHFETLESLPLLWRFIEGPQPCSMSNKFTPCEKSMKPQWQKNVCVHK